MDDIPEVFKGDFAEKRAWVPMTISTSPSLMASSRSLRSLFLTEPVRKCQPDNPDPAAVRSNDSACCRVPKRLGRGHEGHLGSLGKDMQGADPSHQGFAAAYNRLAADVHGYFTCPGLLPVFPSGWLSGRLLRLKGRPSMNFQFELCRNAWSCFWHCVAQG